MQRKYSSCRFARLVSNINSSTFIHILIELIVSFVLLANFFSSIFSRSTMSAWTSSTLNALHTASEQQSCRSCRTVNTVDHCRFNKVSPRGRRDDIGYPSRWQFDGGISFRRQSGHPRQSMDQKSRRIYMYVRPRTGPQSAHLWWPAVAMLQAASVPVA